MIENIDEIKKAKAQIVEGSLTIWNARLDALARTGDVKGALAQLRMPAETGDNCDCQCGAMVRPEDLVTSPIAKKQA